jgi:hypothetical protein
MKGIKGRCEGGTSSTHDLQSEVIGGQYSFNTVIFQEFKPKERVSAINQKTAIRSTWSPDTPCPPIKFDQIPYLQYGDFWPQSI